MADNNPKETNFIVGESLQEFLRLGCIHGFFDLEKLAYSWKAELFNQYSQPSAPDDEPVLQKLRAEFDLTPWPEIESRLHELQKRHLPLLRFRRG